jgi:hypothetical protein
MAVVNGCRPTLRASLAITISVESGDPAVIADGTLDVGDPHRKGSTPVSSI